MTKKEDKKTGVEIGESVKMDVIHHAALEERKKLLEKEITDINKQLAATDSRIQNWMELHDLDSFTTDGKKVVLKPEVRGKVMDAEAFFEHLAKRNEVELVSLKLPPALGAIFKDWAKSEGHDVSGIDIAIAWNALTKYIKDNCDVTDASTWPAGLEVESWDKVVVK